MMQSHRVPNPVAVVNRYWPSRQHAPSFTYTQPSYRFSYRPFALGADFGIPTPCGPGRECPGTTACCPVDINAIPEVGLPAPVCLETEACRVLNNQLEQALCAKHPGDMVLECGAVAGRDWCMCQPTLNPVEGQIPVTPPPQTTKPPTGEPLDPAPAPAAAPKSWIDRVDVPVAIVGGVAALALIYAFSR
jgi:hypothetical protein